MNEEFVCPTCTNDDVRLMALVIYNRELSVIECISCSKLFVKKTVDIPANLVRKHELNS